MKKNNKYKKNVSAPLFSQKVATVECEIKFYMSHGTKVDFCLGWLQPSKSTRGKNLLLSSLVT